MQQYQAKSIDTKHFQLTQADVPVGALEYESWFSFKADIVLADHRHYAVHPKGFWGTTIEVKEQEQVLLDFKMNWKGQILIRTHFGGVEDFYLLKPQGLLKTTFVLVDEHEMELLSIAPNFKWSKLSVDHQLAASEAFEQLAYKELLLLTVVHCANYYLTLLTAAA